MAQLFEPGFRFGKYEILGLLGTGGMSDVYEAVDPTLGRHVAIKVLPPEFTRQDERVRRFEKEVRAVASLNHPGIVTIYEVASFDNYQYYTMSLVPNGDLKHKIRAGLSARESVDVARQVAVALAHAHKHGLIHRDIKPENILFDANHRAVVADFGIAKAVDSDTHMTSTGMSIGTPHYMSPEQAQGMNKVDHRSDLYSLGVVLYEMLTGKVPFDAENTLGIAMKHVTEPAPPLPDKLSEYQSLISRLLSKSPTERYESAEDFVAACDELLARPEGEPVRPVRTARPTRKTKATPPPKAPTPSRQPSTGDQAKTSARPIKRPVPPTNKAGPGSEKIALIVVAVGVIAVGLAAALYFMDWGESPSTRAGITGTTDPQRAEQATQRDDTPTTAAADNAADVAQTSPSRSQATPPAPVEVGSTEPSRPALADNTPANRTEPPQLDATDQAPAMDLTDRDIARTEAVEGTPDTTPPSDAPSTQAPSPDPQRATIEQHLMSGDEALAANRLTRPENDSALYHYRAALALDPDDERAQRGVSNVASTLLSLARGALAAGDPTRADQLLRRSASVVPDTAEVQSLQRQIVEAIQRQARAEQPEVNTDFGLTMQPIKGGIFDMGSLTGDADEQPVREVRVSAYMLATTETTVGQFKQFVDDTGYQTTAEQGEGCWYWVFGWRVSSRRNWQDPGFDQTAEHPVVCVSRVDAMAYIEWLNDKTGAIHFLPSEAQWEYAARVATGLITYWREDAPVSACQYGNFSDIDRATEHGLEQSPDNIFQCEDGYIATAPVAQFRANPWQLHDMLGNVEEWTSGCWTPSYQGIADNDAPLQYTPCSYGVVRGGSWSALPENDRTPNRLRLDPTASYSHTGFRVARANQ